MATIARGAKAGGGTNFNSGQTIDPAEVNTDFNTAYTEINGNLSAANILTGSLPGAKSLLFTGISAPSAPSSGSVLLYLSSTGVLTALNSGSVSTPLGAGRGEVTNLYVTQTSGSEAASVTITADAIDIEGNRATSVNVAASLASSGAGGLDTGAEGSDTTYYLWLIRKSSDGTMNGLFSTSSSSPTMPSGYDQKRLIGHRRNDGSSNHIRQYQCNDLVVCDADAQQLANAISATTDLDTSTYCPAAIADFVIVNVKQSGGAWALDDKTDSTIRYWTGGSSTDFASPWVRKNSSNLITATEVSGTATLTAYLLGWKVKVL